MVDPHVAPTPVVMAQLLVVTVGHVQPLALLVKDIRERSM
jgi:hypothetical protein